MSVVIRAAAAPALPRSKRVRAPPPDERTIYVEFNDSPPQSDDDDDELDVAQLCENYRDPERRAVAAEHVQNMDVTDFALNDFPLLYAAGAGAELDHAFFWNVHRRATIPWIFDAFNGNRDRMFAALGAFYKYENLWRILTVENVLEARDTGDADVLEEITQRFLGQRVNSNTFDVSDVAKLENEGAHEAALALLHRTLPAYFEYANPDDYDSTLEALPASSLREVFRTYQKAQMK